MCDGLIDGAGDLVWARRLDFDVYHAEMFPVNLVACSMEHNPDGTITAYGTVVSGGTRRCFLIQFSSTGTHLWSRWVGDGPPMEGWFYSMAASVTAQKDASGGYYVSMISSSEMDLAVIVHRLNSSGGLDWTKKYRYTGFANDLCTVTWC